MEGKSLKKLVIFYSLQGNTKFIAESIGEITGAELLQLKPEKDIRSRGFIKFVLGGRQAVKGKMPELLPLDKNPDDYDMVFLGTPIWARRYAPAVNTFLGSTEIKGKKIALFCCHAGGGNGKAFSMIKEGLKENEIIGEIEFKEPLKNDREEAQSRLKKWIEEIS